MLAQKPITFLALAQTGTLIAACLTSAMVFKVQSIYFGSNMPERYPSRTAYLMSHWGWLLLALPLAWLIAAMMFNRSQGDSLRGNLMIYGSGILLFGVFLYCTIGYVVALFISISG